MVPLVPPRARPSASRRGRPVGRLAPGFPAGDRPGGDDSQGTAEVPAEIHQFSLDLMVI